MSIFGRRRAKDDDAVGVDAAVADETGPGQTESAAAGDGASPESARGPWDVSDMPDLGARLDLGALRIPGRQGMQLRMEMEKDGSRVVAANIGLEGSALQVQAFAAPRTTGIWDELRAEIATSVTRQGGTADEVPGPFGRELLARLPIRTPEGRTGHRPARFIGIDGPRWFLRAVLTGRAAVDPEAAAALESVIADVVVVRGTEARAPRELLTLHLPGRPPVPATPATDQAPDPLRRGPEITEVR
ncbi:MAG TPA: DUF3710 domain-containing protein [Actinotalea sp.]|nr:DUF3710 domain-containing protein [Actinotalea sp.]